MCNLQASIPHSLLRMYIHMQFVHVCKHVLRIIPYQSQLAKRFIIFLGQTPDGARSRVGVKGLKAR